MMLGDPPGVSFSFGGFAEIADEIARKAWLVGRIVDLLIGDGEGFLLSVVGGEAGQHREGKLLLVFGERADLDAGALSTGEDFRFALRCVEAESALRAL